MNNEKNEYLTTEEHGVLVRFLFSSSVKLRGKILLLALLICSCDLFNGPVQPDFLKKIDEEIAWSNAAKLTVRIDYPSEWGVSNPTAGQITPSPKDIRKGYAFELEFTPDVAYTFEGWRAYDTSVLNGLEGDWRLDLTLLDGVPQISGVETPELSARGGTGSFTINTVTLVTLVPWCKTEPYVIRTDPRSETASDTRAHHPSTPVVAYFNSALDPDMTWGYGNGMVEVIARPVNSNGDYVDYSDRFEIPVYENRGGSYTLTIAPKADKLPEANYQIKVTIGPSIRNAQGEYMSSAEVVTYRVSQLAGAEANIANWTATYNAGGTISVGFSIEGTDKDNAAATAYFQMNQGSDQSFTLTRSGDTFTGTIGGASGLDISGVSEGRGVTNTREYKIFIEVIAGGYMAHSVIFKIWNFPNMVVSNSNQAIEIRTAADLAAIPTTGLGRQYVLAEDITISSHSPINNFTGKFYGNGNTVTINSFAASAGNIGLFGVVGDGALVRDLTVEYSASISPTSAFQFGGIAGTTQGNAQLINVLVRGSVTTSGSGFTAYAGGFAGLMTGTSSINNAYGGLNLTVNTNPGTSNSLYVGGIAGSMGRPDTGDPVKVEKATVVGDITVGRTVTVDTFSVVLVSVGEIPDNDTRGVFVGGLAGFIRGTGAASQAFLLDSGYRQGTISVRVNTGSTWLGGAVGDAFKYAEIIDCHALSGFDIAKTGRGTAFSVGGFIGYADANVKVESCYSNITVAIDSSATTSDKGDETYIGGFVGRKNAAILYCYAKGDVSISSYTGVFVGGFYGYSSGNTDSTIFYCYATGNVSVTSLGTGLSMRDVTQDTIVGGFSGYSSNVGPISHCYGLGDVFLSKPAGTGNVYAGGFAGQITGSVSVANNCFAKGKVTAQSNTGSSVSAGGFLSLLTGTLNNSAALGESVTATGGTENENTRNIGRINGNAAGTFTNNRAYNGMRLYQSATYGSSRPTEIDTLNPAPLATNKHGADANLGDFRTRSFWTGLGFTTANWDHVTVESRGYPILKGPDGRAMGGQ